MVHAHALVEVATVRLTLGIVRASAVLGLALGIALTEGRVQKAKSAHAADRAAWAAQLADARAQALQAEQNASAREHELAAQVEQITQEAQDAKAQIHTDRAAADAAAARLRQQIAALSARPDRHPANPDPAPAGVGQGQPDTRALDLLAELFTRADSTAGELAAHADGLTAAGLACERAYDQARAALAYNKGFHP